MPPRPASRRLRTACTILLVAAVLGCSQEGARRSGKFAPDFEYFYQGGAWLLERGVLDAGFDYGPDGRVVARDSLKWYLPFVPRMMTLIAWLPPDISGRVWYGLNIATALATVWLLGRHLAARPAEDWAVAEFVPFLLLSVFWWWEFRLAQINNLTLLLVVASFFCWRRQQPAIGGFWLGLATLIKVTPALIVLWFLLKRQYRTVAAAIITIALAGPLADLVALGPNQAVDRYRTWLAGTATETSQSGIVLAQTEMDWRNQGMGAVLSRWLHPTNYALRFDNDPRLYAPPDVIATMNVAALSTDAVAWIVSAVQGVSLLALLWLARRPAARLSPWALQGEWSLFVLGMLWFMPVMRGYHLIWALPALSLLGARLHCDGYRGTWSKCAIVCALALAPIQYSLRWTLPLAGGVLLWTVALLAVPVLLLIVQQQRRAQRSQADSVGAPAFPPPLAAASDHA